MWNEAAMGGISVLVMLSAMGFFVFLFFGAVALFVAAVVLTIVFAARTKKRHAQGKKLGGLIALPIVFYVLSVPVLLFFTFAVVVPVATAGSTTDYYDCTEAITTHEPEDLADALASPDLELDDEGLHSYRSLLQVAIAYGDLECVELILEDTQADGRPIDLNTPLNDYDDGGVPIDSDYALIMATSTSFSSLDMVELLIEYGADVNVAGEGGDTPLHNASAGRCVSRLGSGISSMDLGESDRAIDLLLDAGADITAKNDDGYTPWDNYRAMVRYYESEGRISSEDALEILSERAETLEP